MSILPSLLLANLEAMAIFVALFYVLARAPAFRPPEGMRPVRTWLLRWGFFTGISILGSYLGVTLPGGVIANTRAVGAIVAGFMGGPWLGLAVGATAGIHRISLGGYTALAGALSTTLEGLAAGYVHLWLARRTGSDRLPGWRLAAGFTAAAETAHMLIVVAIARPLDDAIAGVHLIGPS